MDSSESPKGPESFQTMIEPHRSEQLSGIASYNMVIMEYATVLWSGRLCVGCLLKLPIEVTFNIHFIKQTKYCCIYFLSTNLCVSFKSVLVSL